MQRTLISATGLVRRLGERTVIDDVDLAVRERSRIGLVGPNGGGKSTLLRPLAGIEPLDSGRIRRHGSVGYLPQIARGDASPTARDTISQRIGVATASRDVDALARRLDDGDPAGIEAHAEAIERWVALGGADADARIESACAELGLGAALLDRPVSELSGGQAARVGLAAVIAARFDVVLLDEPSNHLDLDGLERLDELIASSRAGIVVATHDRDLLSRRVEQVLAMDPANGSASLHGGGWESYERERSAAASRASSEYEQAIRERRRIEAAATEQRRRAAASANRVRGSGADGDKHAREWVEMRADGARRRAARVEHRARKVEIPDKPIERPALGLELSAAERRSGWTVALDAARLRRGDLELGPIDLIVGHGDRVLLRGPNGSGKSTLIDLLLGDLTPDSGLRREAASTVVARLGQDRELLSGERSAAATTIDLTGISESEARTALASFGLRGEAATRPARSLSPGERTRSELALIAQRRATCLLLDEPSNHLDVESLETLEAALATWPGALVLASHDRRFTEALAPWRELEVSGLRASGGDRA